MTGIKKETIQELRERIPKLFTRFIYLLFVVFFMYGILPMLNFLQKITIIFDLSLYHILNVFSPIIALFIIFEIWKEIGPIFDTLVSQFIYTLPGLKRIEKMSIRRILSDFTYVIIVILIVTTLSPMASRLSFAVGNIISLISLMVIFLLFYDAGKISYTMLEKRVRRLRKISVRKQKT